MRLLALAVVFRINVESVDVSARRNLRRRRCRCHHYDSYPHHRSPLNRLLSPHLQYQHFRPDPASLPLRHGSSSVVRESHVLKEAEEGRHVSAFRRVCRAMASFPGSRSCLVVQIR
jgi:hypothetical protein